MRRQRYKSDGETIRIVSEKKFAAVNRRSAARVDCTETLYRVIDAPAIAGNAIASKILSSFVLMSGRIGACDKFRGADAVTVQSVF